MTLILTPPAIIQSYEAAIDQIGLARSKDGQQLFRIATAAMEHATNRSEGTVTRVLEAMFEYESLPLTRAFTTKVRYKIRGAMQPLSYAFDE